MNVVLITGGIGSGKSEVCRILKDNYGIPCYNADSRVKELYMTHPQLLSDIEVALGVSLLDADGRFMPSVLAERIFTSDEDLRLVESIVFPVLAEDFENWKSARSSSDVIIESATALEKESLAQMYDKVVVVDAPFEVRLDRACGRDASEKETVMKRMRAQLLMNRISDGYIDERVDYLLENTSDMASLKRKVEEMIDKVFDDKKVIDRKV
jgi:dephospho-CoA kinase